MTQRYLRSTGAPHYRSETGYDAQMLYNGESALIIASTVHAHGSAPGHHVHEHSDQLYFVTRGEMKIQLGADVFDVGPDTLVYIPRGTPHHNWNESGADEFHFEVLAPAPLVTQQVATATESTECDGSFIVRTVDSVGFTEAMPGFSTSRILQRVDGSEQMALYIGQVEPGGAGPATHVHDFDQFYYLLEGQLNVEIALNSFTARAGDLVILPAGVPHRQWNSGESTERHLTLLIPEPEPGEEWDIAVKLEASGAVR